MLSVSGSPSNLIGIVIALLIGDLLSAPIKISGFSDNFPANLIGIGNNLIYLN